jgi:hypothetical protein
MWRTLSPRFEAALVAAAVTTAPLAAQAATLFSAARTGEQLLGDAAATFPTPPPTRVGSALEFGPGAPGDILVLWDLLPAAGRGALRITIRIDYDPLTSDNDPQFGILVGDAFLGINRFDNTGGGAGMLVGTRSGDTLLLDEVSLPRRDIATGLGPVDPFTFTVTLADEGAAASVTAYREGDVTVTGAKAFPGPPPYLDTDGPLAFAFTRAQGFGRASASGPEQYRLDAVAIEIAPVPVPAALPLLLGAVAALGLLARRRRLPS